jgi:type I restriction enzyme, R subunit
VLKKLLNDEIKARAKKNLVQSRTLMEMLEDAIKRYHAKVLTAAEVMDELINISKRSSSRQASRRDGHERL